MTGVKILFTAGSVWYARLIRFITRSSVSHVAVEYVDPLWGGPMIAEADARGILVRTAKNGRKDTVVVKEYECLFNIGPGFHAVAKYLGQPYDYKGLFLIWWATIAWRWFRRKLQFRSTKNVKCSEFVAKMIKFCNLPGSEDFDTELITPKDLEKYCSLRVDHFAAVERTSI